MNRGGRRAGAGAPTAAATKVKAAAAKSAAARFQERAEADFDLIYNALRDLALGVWVEDEERGRVYQRPPDRGSLQTLVDHLKGKPATQAVTQPDMTITFVAQHVPRPGKEKGTHDPDDGDRRRGHYDADDEAAGPADQGAGGSAAGGGRMDSLGDMGGDDE